MDGPDDKLVDPGLLPWATVTQARYLKAVNEFGGYRSAAAALKVPSHSQLIRSIQALQRRAAIGGYSPDHDMTHPAPNPFTVKGVSTYYGKDGEPRGQWVKTRLDEGARARATGPAETCA